ncbi:flagellar basal-body rod protein FlgB [Gammaproteobacteria bacterium]
MSITFKETLGIHPEALSLRARRAEILAANLTNADTPKYKARDLDFKAILSGIRDSNDEDPQLPLKQTYLTHLDGSLGNEEFPLKYRIPSQPSSDGNSVDPDMERTEFASNSVGYQSSLTFLTGRVRTILTAIKGE